MSNKAIKLFKDYIVITLAVIIMDLGIYAFKFPNHFSFGGVSGLAVVLNEILGISAAQINLVINLALLVIGFAVLGKSFGLKTAYATVLSSVVLSLMEKMMPISAPLTNQPMLEPCLCDCSSGSCSGNAVLRRCIRWWYGYCCDDTEEIYDN